MDGPFLYKDLMSSNMGMLPNMVNPFMPGMYPYPTSMLGSTRLKPQPDQDKFMKMQEREVKERNTFWKTLAAIGVIGCSAGLLFRGKLNIGKMFKSLGKTIAAPFKWFGTKTKNVAKAVGNGAASSSRWAGRNAKNGVKKTGNAFSRLGTKIKNGAKTVGNGITAPFKWLKNKIKHKP